MKLQIELFTYLLTLIVILLAGCSGCGKTTTPEFKPPVETTQEGENPTTTTHQSSGTLPTEFFPPENPYQDITINGEAPPFDFLQQPSLLDTSLGIRDGRRWNRLYNFPCHT